MSKDAYIPPQPPQDCLPDLQVRIDEVTAKLQRTKHEGYANWSKARAQQVAAEACKAPEYAALLWTGGNGIVGVKQLDVIAQGCWDQARDLQRQLDLLEFEKQGSQPSNRAAPVVTK